MTPMALGISDITFRYPGEPSPIFDGLTFEIKEPGFYSLFGLSGAGKSTLAKILAGLLRPEKGVCPPPGAHRILYSHNEERLPIWVDCITHLNSVVAEENKLALEEFIKIALQGVNLAVRFDELSLGQKNRVNLARYIAQDFDCLIMDEALSNVDEPTREAILLFLKQHFQTKTFLYVSHNVMEVVRFSKKIYCLTHPRESLTVKIKEVNGLDDGRRKRRLDGEALKQIGLMVLEAVSSN